MKTKKKNKFFDKHQVFKVVGIFMIVAALLTWVMEIGLYQGGEFVNDEMYRVGLSDFLTYSMFGNYYFPTHFIILVVTAGFYMFLGSLPAYQKLTDNIARKFSNHPAIFAIITMVLLAAFAGVATDYFAAIALIPFFITVLSKLKVDKVVGVASTFGATLIGILGASYSGKVVGELAKTTTEYGLGIKYGYLPWPIFIIFAVSLLLLGYFIFRRCRKGCDEKDVLNDLFAKEAVEGRPKKNAKRVSTLPLAIVLGLLALNIVLGVIAWESVFNITVFKDLFTNITTATLFGEPIFQYIIGNVMTEFGTWDLLTISLVMMITMLIIKIVYSVPFDKLIDEFVEGFKRIVPTVGILLMIFAIILYSGAYPTIGNFIHSILSMGTEKLYVFVCGIVNGVFSPDFSYSLRYTGSAFTSMSNLDNVALALQTGNGFASLIAPSSMMLMVGLSMLKVKYTEWFKFIWKFLILVAVLLIAVLLVI